MSFWKSLAKVGGAVGGFALGGPAGAVAGYGLGSAVGGVGGGKKKGPLAMDTATANYGNYATEDRNRFLNALGGGQQALNASTKAAVSGAMPELDKRLQQTRESAIQRGISTGDLGTSYEGDILSAFQKNLTDSTASKAYDLFNTEASGYGQLANNSGNTYLDLLTGSLDRAQQDKNNKTSFWNSLIGAGGAAAGGYLGGR